MRQPWLAGGTALVALAWVVSGLSPAHAQATGVPDEKTLEDALRKKPVTPKAPPNPASKQKVAAPAKDSPKPPKPAPERTLIPMVVVSDAACALELNGDSIAALEPGAARKLNVWPGDQLVKCTSAEEPGEVFSAVQNIKAGEQTVLQIGLASRIQAVRQKRETDAQNLIAEDELWAQAGQSGTAAGHQAYLDKYPNGRFVEPAKEFLAESMRRAEEEARRAKEDARRAEEDADWKRVANSTQLAAVQSYVDKYPAGRYLDAAGQRKDFIAHLPVRPILPFPIAEDVWEASENAAVYRDLPRRSHKVTVQISAKIRSEPNKGSSTTWSQVTTREIVPLGDKCVLLHTVTRKSKANDAPSDVLDDYQCGPLKLGTIANGALVRTVSLSDVDALIQSDKVLRETPPCEIPNSGPANTFHVALTGTVTRYGCATGDYYFEDLNVWLYELGEIDSEKQQYIIPRPGYHFKSVTDGDSGGKVTTTYERFSWTVGN
jgi:hypothetical protein